MLTNAARLGVVCAVAVLASLACSGRVNGEADGPVETTTMPACTWPASLDPSDASQFQCTAARMLLFCDFANGIGEDCISNDPTRCPYSGPLSGGPVSGGSSDAAPDDGGGFGCKNQCTPGEYAVSCGPGSALGPAAMPPPPPSACRTVLGGDALYCCPCGGS